MIYYCLQLFNCKYFIHIHDTTHSPNAQNTIWRLFSNERVYFHFIWNIFFRRQCQGSNSIFFRGDPRYNRHIHFDFFKLLIFPFNQGLSVLNVSRILCCCYFTAFPKCKKNYISLSFLLYNQILQLHVLLEDVISLILV